VTVSLSASYPIQYPGNGSTVTFSFPWEIFAATDLVVGFISGGIYVQQSSGYTIPPASLGNSGGGQLTFSVAPPIGTTVDLRTFVPQTQSTNFGNSSAYLPENTTNAVDRLTRAMQDAYRQTYTFGIHGPDQESVPWPALPAAAVRAGLYLAFDNNGLPALATGGSGGGGTITQAQFNALLATSPGQPQGVYEPTFQFGYLQYMGPNGALAANINFGVGLSLPNPSGANAAALLIGSGGGGGTPYSAWIITDQAYDNITPGNSLGITAGETQGAGIAPGGQLSLYGGGSFGGQGGEMLVQGGTSANGPGGLTVIAGGNATAGIASSIAIPGDVFIIAGQVGYQGANVHIIATLIQGLSGFIRFRQNSNILMDFIPAPHTPGNFQMYLYQGGGAGTAGQPLVTGGPAGTVSWFSGGFTGSATFGTGHTMTIANGLITGYS
jgi:hypothetical protein